VKKILDNIGKPHEKFKTELEGGSLAKLMETVYDHNLTDEKRELLGVGDNR